MGPISSPETFRKESPLHAASVPQENSSLLFCSGSLETHRIGFYQPFGRKGIKNLLQVIGVPMGPQFEK
jgi:hypothetical protein